jgi:hypothetical protein
MLLLVPLLTIYSLSVRRLCVFNFNLGAALYVAPVKFSTWQLTRVIWPKHVYYKGQCKSVPLLAMWVYWGTRCMAPHILNHGTRLRWAVEFMFRPPGNKPRYALKRELGWSKKGSGRFGTDETLQLQLAIEPRTAQLVACPLGIVTYG